MTNFKKTTLAIVASGLLSSLGSVHAADVPVFNYPDPATFAIKYGDFYSFSLPITSAAATGFTDTSYGQDSLYYINTANTIQGALVIGTGSGGNQSNADLNLTTGLPNSFVQNGYDFPNVNGNGVATFSTTDPNTYPSEPGGTGLNTALDVDGTWDISLDALRKYLTVDGVQYDMVAYFNNNQQFRTAEANNLWAWAEVTLEDTDGSGGSKTLYLKNPLNNTATSFDLFGHQEYVLSGGPVTLCLKWNNGTNNTAGSSSLGVIDTLANCKLAGGNWIETFEHNLGQNNVSYGITSLDVNAVLRNLNSDYDVMRVRVDFGGLNNGFENLYIGAACVNCGFQVPEPNALALAALGLLGIGLVARRRRQS